MRGALIRDLYHQVHNAAADLGLLDPREGLDQGKTLGACQEPVELRCGKGVGRRTSGQNRGGRSQAVEEERDRHLENGRELLQTPRTDAVRALLVLLNLLKREAERLPKLLLSHV